MKDASIRTAARPSAEGVGPQTHPTLGPTHSERPVTSRASRPAALPSEASVSGSGGRNRHSSSRPPLARTALAHSGHHGLTRREVGSTMRAIEPLAGASRSRGSRRARLASPTSLRVKEARMPAGGSGRTADAASPRPPCPCRSRGRGRTAGRAAEIRARARPRGRAGSASARSRGRRPRACPRRRRPPPRSCGGASRRRARTGPAGPDGSPRRSARRGVAPRGRRRSRGTGLASAQGG